MKHFKHWFIPFVLGMYLVFLTYLLVTGTISKYINPKLSFLSIIALILFAGMLLFSLKRRHHQESEPDHQCTCGHHETENFRKSSLIILLPVLLAFTVAPQILSYQPVNSASLTKQPVNSPNLTRQPVNTAVSTQSPVKNQLIPASKTPEISQPEKNNAPVEYEEYTQSTIGNIVFNGDESSQRQLVNANILLKGMVLHSPKLKPNEVVVYRMLITCCTADGMDLGVLVKLPANLDFADDDWIGVEGSIKLLPLTDELQNIEPIANVVPLGSKYPYFTATNAYKIPAPENPYLYP